MLRLVACLLLCCCGAPFTTAFDINGWYPCTLTDLASQSILNDVTFECATVEVPLCHPEVCNSTKTIELFVKRKLGERHEGQEVRKSVWFLAGGPGASSADLEYAMLEIYALSESSIDVYTMDHRGTGRSSFLECVAAQALAGGSPGATDISFEELPYCVKDIFHQIDGHTEAFSVTSAARDLIYLLEGLGAGEGNDDVEEVYLYGVSYGTYLVERIMHLAPSCVKGYILDGVVSESGVDADTRLYFSHWDRNILGPSRRFFELCLQQQPACPLRLNVESGGDVLDAVFDIYDELDQDPNDCTIELMYLTESQVPSEVLRPFLGLLVRDPSVRRLVPSILARMQRCSSSDHQELRLVVGTLLDLLMQQAAGATISVTPGDTNTAALLESLLRTSPKPPLSTTTTGSIDQLVYMLISFSELWSDPSPTEAELEQFYEDGVFSVGPGKLETYCLLSGNLASASSSNRDRACASVGAELENAGVTTPLWNSTPIFTYQVDEYSNRTATVPPNSSVLMINGGFDFQTPWEFGRHQFESMALGDPDSSSKMMIEFEFGSHVCGLSPTTKDDDTLCGPSIVASFILESGDTEAVDTSCMANLPELELNDDAFAMVVESLVEAQREQKLNDGTEASG